mmetsp:Transcript_6565/g.17018  ORF Transcript_6565/g.17018 Transcript_6565/m.17018 type:complete len:246 (-) Transcript_6565:439-1176(-)
MWGAQLGGAAASRRCTSGSAPPSAAARALNSAAKPSAAPAASRWLRSEGGSPGSGTSPARQPTIPPRASAAEARTMLLPLPLSVSCSSAAASLQACHSVGCSPAVAMPRAAAATRCEEGDPRARSSRDRRPSTSDTMAGCSGPTAAARQPAAMAAESAQKSSPFSQDALRTPHSSCAARAASTTAAGLSCPDLDASAEMAACMAFSQRARKCAQEVATRNWWRASHSPGPAPIRPVLATSWKVRW